MIGEITRLFQHARWADEIMLAGLRRSTETPAEAWGEYGHILGATETWLSRLELRPSRSAVWNTDPPAALEILCKQVHDGFGAYLGKLTAELLATKIPYTNSLGKSFEGMVGDILLHVAMHAQYHRGKINLVLRQSGLEPLPTDYIAFTRGVPAATRRG